MIIMMMLGDAVIYLSFRWLAGINTLLLLDNTLQGGTPDSVTVGTYICTVKAGSCTFHLQSACLKTKDNSGQNMERLVRCR